MPQGFPPRRLFLFRCFRIAAMTRGELWLILKRETYHVHRWWVGDACDRRLVGFVRGSPRLSVHKAEIGFWMPNTILADHRVVRQKEPWLSHREQLWRERAKPKRLAPFYDQVGRGPSLDRRELEGCPEGSPVGLGRFGQSRPRRMARVLIDKERLPRRKQGTGSSGTEGALIFRSSKSVPPF